MHTPGPWIVSGDLIKSGDGNVACVLSDNPNPDALLISGAPRLRKALADLVEWSAIMGGWDSPCWDRARAALDATRPMKTVAFHNPNDLTLDEVVAETKRNHPELAEINLNPRFEEDRHIPRDCVLLDVPDSWEYKCSIPSC